MLIVFTLISCVERIYHESGNVVLYVDATSDWVNTGVQVHRGQEIVFHCEGSWAVAPLNESERWPDTGPEGHGNHPGERVHRAGDSKKEMPGIPFGTLLGMVDHHIFAIGSQNKIIMPADGMLYMVINDYPFYRHDNRGGLTVTISKE